MTEALHVINFEHSRIWRILITLEKLCLVIESSGEPPDQKLFGAIFDYLNSFSLEYHYPKEELLFKKLRQRNAKSKALIDELELEHRKILESIEALRNEMVGTAAFSKQVKDFIQRKREHIKKEDRLIIPLARDILSEADWRELNTMFAEPEHDSKIGEAMQEDFRELHRIITNYAPEPIGLGLEHRQVPESKDIVLDIQGLSTHYGRIQVLEEIDLSITKGELVVLVGANGAGKTTLLRTISGVQRATAGRIVFVGEDITDLPTNKRVQMGIVQVPEGRQMFGPLSVKDNLILGGVTRSRAEVAETMTHMFDMFPILKQKRKQAAGTLSGGQQQMLAIARALMARPRLLLLDEPSMGLAPLLVDDIFQTITTLKDQEITIFLVEQNAYAALSIADRGYVIETGKTVLTDSGKALLDNERVKAAYLGM